MDTVHIENIGIVAPLVFIIAMLCMPPGVGGGILFVPLLNLVGRLPSKNATAMSQGLIMSATVAKVRMYFALEDRHLYFQGPFLSARAIYLKA